MTAVIHHVRSFAHRHDDVPAFHAAFLVCTVLAASLFNSGYFLLLILAHMALDFVKYRDVHRFSLRLTFKGMLMESISDIALLLISLTIGIYLSHAPVITALSGLLRSGVVLLRAVGTILPKVRILENLVPVFSGFHSYMHSVHPDLDVPLTRIQHWSVRAICGCFLLLGMSVILFHGQEDSLLTVLIRELVPAL